MMGTKPALIVEKANAPQSATKPAEQSATKPVKPPVEDPIELVAEIQNQDEESVFERTLEKLRTVLAPYIMVSDVSACSVGLGPELAHILMDNFNLTKEEGIDIENRKTTQRTVNNYAADMTRGKWLNTGEPLIFTQDGIGTDLQHRCLAVIQSGCTIPVTVITGVNIAKKDLRRTMLVTGTASRRTDAQLAGMANFPRDLWKCVQFYITPLETGTRNSKTWNNLDVNDVFAEREEFFKSGLAYVETLYSNSTGDIRKLFGNRKPVVAAAYLKMQDENFDKSQIDFFFDNLFVFANDLPAKHPINLLRTELDYMFTNAFRDDSRPPQVITMLLLGIQCLTAWDHPVANKKAKVVKWSFEEYNPARNRPKRKMTKHNAKRS
jgi:hypothetical protein